MQQEECQQNEMPHKVLSDVIILVRLWIPDIYHFAYRITDQRSVLCC